LSVSSSTASFVERFVVDRVVLIASFVIALFLDCVVLARRSSIASCRDVVRTLNAEGVR
jgi:hypothetical protein